MNYDVKELDKILQEKGMVGWGQVSEILNTPDTKVFSDGVEVKYELPEKAKIDNINTKRMETKMEIGKDINEIDNNCKKGNKMNFWNEMYKQKSFQGKVQSFDLQTKAWPDNATTRPELSGAIREAVLDLTAMIYQSKIVDRVRKIPMDTTHLKIPVLNTVSGWAATQTEGQSKAQVNISGDYVNLETATESAFVTVSNQALKSVSAFATLVPEMLSAQISANLEGKVTNAIKTNSGKYQVETADVSGLPGINDLAEAYTHLFYRVDGKKALVCHPAVLARILSLQNISGTWGIIHIDGDKPYFLDAEIITSPCMTAPASGASGTYAFVNMNYIAIGQYGEVTNEFNPYYAWESNGSSIRVEGEFAVAAMIPVNIDISGFTFSDTVVQTQAS